MKNIGIIVPEIIFPNENVDLNKFSVNACDQYSAEPAYWEDVKNHVGESPSSLNMIVPEAFLGETDEKEVTDTIKAYLDNGTLKSIGKGFVYVHRETSSGIRRGLVAAFDIAEYGKLIRPTEKVVKERLPERIKIRKDAILEMPHGLVLINDIKNELFTMLDKYVENRKTLYDFNLYPSNQNIKGWFINEKEIINSIFDILSSLIFNDMLYAIGDGNHSFAAAKECYDKYHKDRYILAEIINLYDEGLLIEPIHRLVYNADIQKLQKDLDTNTPLQELQPKLDKWLEENGGSLEYIHGKTNCERLAKEKNGLAITWDKFSKETLFSDVLKNGVLCRKSFSIGEAIDKRYYLECRRI